MKRTSRRWPLTLAVATAVTGAASITVGLVIAPADRSATVAAVAAPAGETATLAAADDTSGTVTIARPDGNGGVQRVAGDELKLASYDPRAGKARLVGAPRGGKPQAGKPVVRKGDVIASGRSKTLPHGALVKVTDDRADAAGQVSVTPATLPDLLGDQKITTSTPVPSTDVTVKPLTKGVTATIEQVAGRTAAQPGKTGQTGAPAPSSSVATPPVSPSGRASSPAATPPASPSAGAGDPSGPATPSTGASVAPPTTPPTQASPSAPTSSSEPAEPATSRELDGATLLPPAAVAPAPLAAAGGKERHNVGSEIKLDLDVPVGELGFTGTAQAGPTLSGWVHLQPQVIFNYERAHWYSVAPSAAAIGIGGAYDYGWKVHAGLAGTVDTGRKPLRLPFAEVHVHTTLLVGGFPVVVDADLTYFYQVSASGKITVDAEQKTAGELSLGVRYSKDRGWSQIPLATSHVTPGRKLEINGAAEAKATIGAQFDVALYGAVGAGLEWAPYLRADAAAGTSTAPRWGVYAGFEAKGQLFAQLKILGIKLFEKRLDLPPLRKEWQIAGSKPAAPGGGTAVTG
ncbi:superantigen-like protein SSL4 [Couchioplanes azureus]|uniref:hypothetical protein n=1 Tax=Couchioplanes caeruleus TaxID=56438 RepID=UPI00166FD0A1|nr:hypothetical protein [Couchioplanes caeruleus]GGQ49341.1 hypothetical protein GCM10010166_17160 [Couchioplanes caeruleus subsp. azureus]